MTWHAIEQAEERYGLWLSLDDIRRMKSMIRAGDRQTVRPRPGAGWGRAIAILWHGRWVALAYKHRAIVTALPQSRLYPFWHQLRARQAELRRAALKAKGGLS